MKQIFHIFYLLFSISLFYSCQKQIKIDLPDTEQKISVDGRIEYGLPPYIILTHNIPYFGHSDIIAMQNMFVHNAVVKVNGITLEEYCTQSLPDSLLPLIAFFTGIDTASLRNFNYCLYTTFNTTVWGNIGTTYNLTINADGKHLTSFTDILNPVPLDSVWYKYFKTNNTGDSLGFVYAHFTDPAAQGNAYRWLAMRKGKDKSFVTPSSSVFDDKFINGQSFDFAYNRGEVAGSTAADDNNEEYGWFKKGDTVIVKFCTIDRTAYDFFRQAEIAIYSQGDPFAAPTSVKSNVYPHENALGVWCGYGVYMDTVVFR